MNEVNCDLKAPSDLVDSVKQSNPDWEYTTCEETYFQTLSGKWHDIHNKIWESLDGKLYKIDRQNFITEYVDIESIVAIDRADNSVTLKRTISNSEIEDENTTKKQRTDESV